MGNTSDKRRLNEMTIIPDDILKVFEENEIYMVFEYMQKNFHLNPKHYHQYLRDLKNEPRAITPQEFACRFIQKNIEPHLNIVLMRTETMFPLIRYLLKDKIKSYRIEQQAHKSFYKSDTLKKDFRK